MKLLLDTHVFLWCTAMPTRLAADVRGAIQDGANEVFVSAATAWEIAIKQSIGKLDLPRPAEQWVPDMIARSHFEIADVALGAALRVRSLPWHHRDPFDRLLIAQALEGGYTLVTHDPVFSAYGVAVMSA